MTFAALTMFQQRIVALFDPTDEGSAIHLDLWRIRRPPQALRLMHLAGNLTELVTMGLLDSEDMVTFRLTRNGRITAFEHLVTSPSGRQTTLSDLGILKDDPVAYTSHVSRH